MQDSVPHIAAQINAAGVNVTSAYKPSLIDDDAAYFVNRPAIERAFSDFIADAYTPTALQQSLSFLPDDSLEEIVQEALLVVEGHNVRHYGSAGRAGVLTLRLLNYTLSGSAVYTACISLLLQDDKGYIISTVSMQGSWPAHWEEGK